MLLRKTDVTYVYVYKSTYLSPLGWPCIYSRSLTGWIMTGIYSHWMRSFPYCQPRFSNGLVRGICLELSSFFIGECLTDGLLLFFFSFIMGFDWMNRVSFGEYSILCIRKIWVDWPGMGFPIYPSSCFGPNESGLCFGLLWWGMGVAWSPLLFWAGEWNTWPISLSPS